MTCNGKSLTAAIENYFADCDAANEKQKKIIRPYTLSGLLYALGIDKETYRRLCTRKQYAALFARARARIEAFLEENTLCGNLSATAAMSTLKCHFGWGDTDDQTEPSGVKTLKIVLDSELLPLAE